MLLWKILPIWIVIYELYRQLTFLVEDARFCAKIILLGEDQLHCSTVRPKKKLSLLITLNKSPFHQRFMQHKHHFKLLKLFPVINCHCNLLLYI